MKTLITGTEQYKNTNYWYRTTQTLITGTEQHKNLA